MSKLTCAVILAGCGNKDGSEIQEAVLTLLAIDRAGAQYQCFAPDINQYRVVNYLNNTEIKERRNVLLESARIARSKIKPLSDYDSADFDALILPGGTGVAYNLCTFAQQGLNMGVNPDVKRAVLETHNAGKPIGALCISPVIIGKLIPGVQLTFGQDAEKNELFEKIGVSTVNTTARDIVVDAKNKVVSTPCYMVDARISEIAEGIDALVLAVLKLARA